MKVIGLSGAENTGKSHVINIVYQFLLNQGYQQVPGHFRVLGNRKFEDILDVLQKDEKIVGIIGMGDYKDGIDSLKNLLAELQQKGCTVAICACRNDPAIEKAVTDYPNNHLLIKTTTIPTEDHWRIDNNTDANKIVSLV